MSHREWPKLKTCEISTWQISKAVFQRCSSNYVFLKIYANFTGRHLCRSIFLIKSQTLRPTTLLKRGSNTGVFL